MKDDDEGSESMPLTTNNEKHHHHNDRNSYQHKHTQHAKKYYAAAGFILGLLAMYVLPHAAQPAQTAMPPPPQQGETTCGGFSAAPAPYTKRYSRGQPTNVLVTGGAGFIGSHFALALLDLGRYNVTVVDDLSRSSIDTILRLQTLAAAADKPFNFENLDVSRQFEMEAVMVKRNIDLVVHFSGNAYVGESMVKPEDYFQNITVSTVALIRAMDRAGVRRLIFSSSCATFGNPSELPISERTPQRPTSPYGAAKLQAEQAIIAFVKSRERAGIPFSAALLRYFNVIGADPAGRLGPHLIHAANKRYPRIVDAAIDAALGQRDKLMVTGSDFPTKDGSAVRDYIHVTDLVDAHVALMPVLGRNELLYYNVGNGKPYTVLEIVNVVKKISGRDVPYQLSAARPGDPHSLYADPKKIQYELGWAPKYADIESMVRHSWDWRIKHYGPTPAPSVDPLAHSGPAFNETTDDAPPLGDNPKIVIIGAGPTGLCAAYRLAELGYKNWELLEGSDAAAGLACSIKDENDFWWDIGVHCLFSHFQFFDALLDNMLAPRDWLYHQRYSPARMRDTWVGYPVQANLWRLPQDEVMSIVADLAQKDARPPPPKPRNFRDWLHAGFGVALTNTFMAPYNAKVWAHPADEMNYIWVGERVAAIRFKDILGNVINKKDAPAWGPNAQFRYPMNGTGHIWLRVFDELPATHKRLGARVAKVRTRDAAKKALVLADGSRVRFDGLLSTMPLPSLLRMMPDHPEMAALAEGNNGAADHSRFKHQSVNLVGIGIEGTDVPAELNGVHWVYFPEDEFIFYRATVLSNFSPLMVAKPYKQWSLLVEVSESKHRQQAVGLSPAQLRQKVKEGLILGGLLPKDANVVSMWSKRLEYGYPVPYVERNMHVHAADAALRKHGIWSRGRFGSWKYEVGNQDHSCMLGVDAVDSMLFGKNNVGREATFNSPNKVNNMYRAYDYNFDAAELAREAGRKHTFGAPKRLSILPQWDFVSWRCNDKDDWTDDVRRLLVRQKSPTKWLIHSYEVCGAAEKKRPMLEMLREGLNHLDRIPHPSTGSPYSAWVRHIVAREKKALPNILVFVRGGQRAASPPFGGHNGITQALKRNPDFGIWGGARIELPDSLRDEWCSLIWKSVHPGERCPSNVATLDNSVLYASEKGIRATPATFWTKLLNLLSSEATAKQTEKLLDYGFHVLVGGEAVVKRMKSQAA